MILIFLFYAVALAGFMYHQKIGVVVPLALVALSCVLIDPALAVFAYVITQLTVDAQYKFFDAEKPKGWKQWLIHRGYLSGWIGLWPTVMILLFLLIVSISEYLT